MNLKETTPEMVQEWKALYSEYRDKLSPNRKPAHEIVKYLRDKYPLADITDASWGQTVIDNVVMNDPYKEKLPEGKKPSPVVFKIENISSGKRLYEQQDEIFNGSPIVAGIDLETGYFHVEGSSDLWDELFAFRGLDEADLENFYLVAEYVNCLRKFGLLDKVLSN
jgi:hypothetical protein